MALKYLRLRKRVIEEPVEDDEESEVLTQIGTYSR